MQAERWLLTNQHLQDLNPLIAGEQACDPGYSFGPSVRSYTLLHYVVSGKGTLFARGREWPVHAGQVFLIRPGEVTTYWADATDPWHYRWIGFDGGLSRRFSELPAVFDVDRADFYRIFPVADAPGPEFYMAGGLLGLYARLFPANASANVHVRKVEGLIRTAYMHRLRVDDIARELNLDRRYLTRLFKEKTGRSIQEYLVHVRMEEADRCLRQGHSVKTTAQLCGYEDVSNFSRMYKKHFGVSPGNIA